MRDALNRRFDVVLAESLDRFSRDQEDTAGLFKRLTFAGVSIVTLAEGDITHLHIGFKGTMNALFLKDLAEKTHRGLRGRIEDGKSAGGLCYGYRIVKALKGGTVTTGEREIEPGEAAVVERMFREFIAGVSPKQIAKNLNREGVPGPFGGPINLPVGRLFVEEVITECRKRGATRVDVLAFEFEMGLFPAVLDEAKQKGIDLTPNPTQSDRELL
jgi:Resolvase, N terminal domain/Recombinase